MVGARGGCGRIVIYIYVYIVYICIYTGKEASGSGESGGKTSYRKGGRLKEKEEG